LAEPAALNGKKGLRVTLPAKVTAATPQTVRVTGESLIVVEGLEFGDGVIEAEIAGEPAPGAPATSRGFVGIAFRVQNDMRTLETFYLRPTNGRAEDQERRNHTAQYASNPDWPFSRTRKETPSKYEAYVDMLPSVVRMRGSMCTIRSSLHSSSMTSSWAGMLRVRLHFRLESIPSLTFAT
jgi:hypothetical protein